MKGSPRNDRVRVNVANDTARGCGGVSHNVFVWATLSVAVVPELRALRAARSSRLGQFARPIEKRWQYRIRFRPRIRHCTTRVLCSSSAAPVRRRADSHLLRWALKRRQRRFDR